MSARPARHNAARITDGREVGRSFWAASDLVGSAEQSSGPRHARQSSASKYAAHIGRVGALAVFLGVGLAAANGPGIAVAFASSDADSASGAASGGTAGGSGSSDSGSAGTAGGSGAGGASDAGDGSGTSAGASGSGSTSDSDSGDTAGADADAGAADQDTDTGASGSDDADGGGSTADDGASAGGSGTTEESTDPQEPDSSVDPETPSAVATPDAHSGSAADAGQPQATGSTGATAAATDAADDADAADKAPAQVDEQVSAASAPTKETVAAVSALSVEPTSIESAAPEQAARALVVAAALDPIFVPYTLPSIPTGGSWLDVLIASVWRDISHTWFNKKPVATYTSEQVLLTTTYTVDVVDPNGDPLSFAIIQPEHGLVTWVPFTNKFLYTPDLFYTGDPVTETFQIIFSDSVQNDKTDWLHTFSHSLARSWGLAEEDDLTLTIPVTVTPLYAAPLVTTLGAPSFILQGNPVKVLSAVSIADADSDEMSGAVVKLTTLSQDGDVLGYTAPEDNPITGTWDAATKTLTLTGAGTKAQYEEALKAVTFSATQGPLLVRGVEFWVTDDTQTKSLTPGIALVNVFNPLAPAVGVLGTPTFTLEGEPVKVLYSVTITDADSDTLSSAAVKLTTLSQDGDTLSYTAPQDNPITGTWDASTRILTLSGTGTIDQYEEALKAVTFSATQGALLVRGVEVWVTDSTHMTSLLPGIALINVSAAPLIPLVSTLGAPNYVIGKDPVTLLASATIADLDSETMSGAVVKINTFGQTGDVLGYTAPQDNPITGTWDAATKTLTLSGAGTKAQYEEALEAVTFSATTGAGLVRGFLISVTDSTGMSSGWSGAATATVSTPLPPAIGTLGAPTFTISGAPVTVLASVTITDLDSDTLSGATVRINTLGQTGDVLGYTAPQDNPITGVWDAATKTLTLSGTGTIDQYEAALKAVTFTATQGAGLVRGLLINVTDDMGVQSLAAGVATIIVNAPLIPLVSTLGAPNYVIGKDPVTLLASVTITDLDSDNMSGAVVKINTLGQTGDVLGYTAPQDNPITATWDAATKTLTLTGTGTKAQYEEALKAVTFSATTGAGLVRGFLISVTDNTGMSSGWSGAATATVSTPLPPAIGTLGAPTFTIDGDPVTVLASVTITDGDSTSLSGATVKINTLGQTGDVLGYTAPQDNPITATWDAGSKTLTLTGAGTIDQYEAALKAVTFTATQGAGLVRGLLINVTDDMGVQSLAAGIATIVVNAAPLIPLVSTLGAPNYIIGKSPVQLLASVTVTDLDSDNMASATVKINTFGQTGDVLGYTAPQGNPITATWDAASKTLTLSGTATKAQYEEALKAVTFSATTGAGLVRGFLISVTDSTGLSSGWSGAATATVATPLPPAIATLGSPTFTIGGSSVTVLASVTITDGDSATLSGGTVKINTLGQGGDVLGYTAPQGNPITASWDASSMTLTLSGTGTIAQYEAALKAVTFTATQGVALVRGLLINVTDEMGVQSLLPGVATVNVTGLTPLVSTLGAPNYVIGKPAVQLLGSVTVTDGDSATMSGAKVKINTLGQPGDVLGYTAPQGNPVTGVWDSSSMTLTLSGTATKAQYEEALKAITFSATQGAALVRGFLISVTDSTGLSSGWSGAATATVANPVGPAIATLGAPTFTLFGSPVTVLASVTITDLDSDTLSGAAVKINTLGQGGDVLGYTAPQGNPITASWDASSLTLTLSGTGTIAQYEAALKAVTFTATQGAGLVRGLLINVTDDTGLQSAAGIATVNVNAPLIPLVSTLGAPNYVIGKPAVQLLGSVTVTDGDSATMSSARVKINTFGQPGDVLGYTAPQGNPITASWDASSMTITLSGTATKAQYEAALRAVTFSATQGAGLVRGFLISVTDNTGMSSGWSGAATATVANPVGPAIGVLTGPSGSLGGAKTNLFSSVTITDLDSDYMTGATVKITVSAQSNDKLYFDGISGIPVSASYDSGSKTLTLTGTATKAQYEQVLRAVTWSSTQWWGVVRSFEVRVTDDSGLTSPFGFVSLAPY
ncbi:MAG: hypothetical protein U0R18_07210 [Mycobacterium sp.]